MRLQFLKKTACYRRFKKWHFVRVCMQKMMDHQYRENGARNIHSNHIQMRAYVECSPNQSKSYTLSTFLSSNRQNFKDFGKVLTVSVSEFYQSITRVQLYQPMYVRWLSLTTGWENVNLLYFPDITEIVSLEGLTLWWSEVNQSKQPLAWWCTIFIAWRQWLPLHCRNCLFLTCSYRDNPFFFHSMQYPRPVLKPSWKLDKSKIGNILKF